MKALTVAIWCLCLVIAAEVALALWSQIQMRLWRSEVTYSRAPANATRTAPSQFPLEGDFNGFNALPIEQKIQRASVILITRFKRDGDAMKAIVTDIPKQRAGTTFYYSVGQEFTEASVYREAGAEYGDGAVVFLIGSPAQMVESYSYSHERVGGLGSMPLAHLRDLAAKSK